MCEDEKKNLIKVQMFGEIRVEAENWFLNEDLIRSTMLTKLLAYVLINHEKMLTVQELGDALWSEEETDNQVGALKNLMYRLRNMLKKHTGVSDFILTGQGTYYWNRAYSVQLDCEMFEDLCSRIKSKAGGTLEERQEAGEKAVVLYKADFLPKISSEHWVIPIAVYYHSMYLTLATGLAELYKEGRKYEEMERVCQRAITQDGLDEYLNCLMIEALRGQHKDKMALKHYEAVVKLLYENLGVKPSGRLREVYMALLSEVNAQEMDLRTIQMDLREAVKPSGVFMCEYGVFREMYRLHARQAERMGMSVFVILFTLSPPAYVSKGSESYLSLLNQAMSHMKAALQTLRAGDVAAKYSGAQYVVMVPTCTCETAKNVINRVEKKFFEEKKWNKFILQYSLEAIEFPV